MHADLQQLSDDLGVVRDPDYGLFSQHVPNIKFLSE